MTHDKTQHNATHHDHGADNNGMDHNSMDNNGMDSNGMDSNGMDSNGMDSNGAEPLTQAIARDALLDQGLRELAGGSSPPDLTARIIAVATQSASAANGHTSSLAAPAEAAAPASRLVAQSRGWGRELLCSACLLAVAVGGYFLGGGAAPLQWAMNANRRVDKFGVELGLQDSVTVDRSPLKDLESPSTNPSPYYHHDVQYYPRGSEFNIGRSVANDEGRGEGLYPTGWNGSGGGGANTAAQEGANIVGTAEAPGFSQQGLAADTQTIIENSSHTPGFTFGNPATKLESSNKGGADGDRSGGGGKGGGQSANSAGGYANVPRTVTKYTTQGDATIRYTETKSVYELGGDGTYTIHKPVYEARNGSAQIAGVAPGDPYSDGTPMVGTPFQVFGRPTPEQLAELQKGFGDQKTMQEGLTGDRFRASVENRFLDVRLSPLSTFSIDVDTASYSKVRRMILQEGQLPPADAVRIEEFLNYFSYDYPRPAADDAAPFAVNTELAACPWQPEHYLLRVALAGKVLDPQERPKSNLVFLLDVSGSMDSPDKLPLVKEGLRQLVERLGENDRVAIVVYAGSSGLVLESTPGTEKARIISVIDQLQPQGSTNGASGIQLAYQLAEQNFIPGGTNRVILCTDGDFNVGVTSDGELVRLVEEKAQTGVFLTALGFGIGNHNDSMLEQIADRGNGTYGYVDSRNEANRIFAQQMSGTLVTIAKDVKIQIEFNPAQVGGYRLIGYENRMLQTEDFADDKKDAGEIGAGHTVTALYEIIPAAAAVAPTPGLKYQRTNELTDAAAGGEFANVALRYKQPEASVSELLEVAVADPRTKTPAEDGKADGEVPISPMPVGSEDLQFAAAVASFAMQLRHSEYQGQASFDAVLEMARGAGADEFGYRREFLQIVERAKAIAASMNGTNANGERRP